MRSEFVQCRDRETAKLVAPWAVMLVRVEGGFRAFESWSDYVTWSKQR